MKTSKSTSYPLVAVIIFLFGCFFILGCQEKTLLQENDENQIVQIKNELDTSIFRNADFIKLWDLQEEMWSRLSNHPIDSICNICANQDTVGLVELMGYTESELQSLVDTMSAAVQRLALTYPGLEDIADTSDCHCGDANNSELFLAPVCEFLKYLDDNDHLNDVPGYFEDLLDGAVGGDPPTWLACLPVCMLNCLPLSYYPPAYAACVLACEVMCGIATN